MNNKFDQMRSMISDGLRRMDYDFDYFVIFDNSEWTIDTDLFMGKPVVHIPHGNTMIGVSDYYPVIIPAWEKDDSYSETALGRYLKGCEESEDNVADQRVMK